jgi:protein TonB
MVPRAASVDAAALAAYGRELAGAVATRQRYPRVALMRQWQGTAMLQLDLAPDGRLLGVRVISSSGHDTLDRQALEMVREAVPLPSLPEALAGRPLTVDVPVVFRIAS